MTASKVIIKLVEPKDEEGDSDFGEKGDDLFLFTRRPKKSAER